MIIKGKQDESFFDYRRRLKDHKKYQIRFYIGGRNIGKTTQTARTEFQNQYAQYKNGLDPQPVGFLVRTEKLWAKIKSNFLQNLTTEPFNMPLRVEGSKIWWVKEYEKTNKDGETLLKYKRLFQCGEILFLWSANAYKQGNLEHLRCLVMDEIVPEHEGYIPNEIAKFETMVSTFTRLSPSKYVIGIANSITDASPYFDYIGVTADTFPNSGETFIDPTGRFLLEYCWTPPAIQELIDKSTAGIIQRDRDYGKMASGRGILKSENYLLLANPRGETQVQYNVFIENESYVVHKYAMHEVWIEKGNNPYVKDYFLDKESAVRQNRPYDYFSPDWFANLINTKLQKDKIWFKEYETREIFFEWLHKNF